MEVSCCPDCGSFRLNAIVFECLKCGRIKDDRQIYETDVIEVHNVWTIYGLDPDGSEADEPIAQPSRPQDWGDPHWRYHKFGFEWYTPERLYINNCHCWTDMKRELHEYPILFAGLIVQVYMPGQPWQLCGKDFLAEGDFWFRDWGPQPPIYDPYEDEDYSSEVIR